MLTLPKISPPTSCKVCHAQPVLKCGALDFNHVGVEVQPFPPMGQQVEYWQCQSCGFAWSPDFDAWTDDDFSQHIYNADIHRVESEQNAQERSANIQVLLDRWLAKLPSGRLLDYGCGPGVLVDKMRASGFDAVGYDRFYAGFQTPPTGGFDVVTCFEVLEHVNRIDDAIDDIVRYLAPDGLLVLGTFLTNVPMRTDWWYCSPRSGHISFWTFRALSLAFNRRKLNVASDGQVFHFVFSDTAKWKINQIFGTT